jgi:DtxR family Mn-dependent transcriptional regulator
MPEPDPLLSLLVATLFMGMAFVLFWPERGLVSRWQQAYHFTERVRREDALKHILNCEMNDTCPTVQSVAGALHITVNEAAALLSRLEAHALLQRSDGKLGPTAAGREYARQIIRAHRLWERYLADRTGFTEVEWHQQAERHEHDLTPAEVDALAARLGNPIYDPHGDPIPTVGGGLIASSGHSLTAMPLGEPVYIVHLEDEPEAVYAQLVAEGLRPGMELRVTDISPQRVRFWAHDGEHVLAPIVAANISVVARPTAPNGERGERLSSLRIGERGAVLGISRACRSPERRRLMDLGILPGTVIAAELTSPSGDPTAYRVRDTLIALRRNQADLIYTVPRAETQETEKSANASHCSAAPSEPIAANQKAEA